MSAIRQPGADWVGVLTSALDEVEYGIVVLDEDLNARLINRAFHRMWALPTAPAGAGYSFVDLMQHGSKTHAYEIEKGKVDEYVRQRIALVRDGTQPPVQLRLSDGRILKFECIALPDGGRMLTYADISQFVQTAEQLRELATIDDLTKLLNRRQFMASLDDEFSIAVRDDRQMSVVMIDADHFKQINDRHGHQVGDEVLRAIADRCRDVILPGSILGRLGGEEFAAAFGVADMPGAVTTAERIRREVAATPVDIGGEKVPVTISVGVAARRAQDTDPAELIRLADRALYAAKAGGRNRVAVDPGTA